MKFELLDGYLLDGKPQKAEVVETLLRERPREDVARANYEGLKILGPRTPDLALIALRLVLAGKTADDLTVKRLRNLVDDVRKGGPKAASARSEYEAILSS